MTLEEKIGQMVQVERTVATLDAMNKYLIGTVLAPKPLAEAWVDMVNVIQKGSLSTRLGNRHRSQPHQCLQWDYLSFLIILFSLVNILIHMACIEIKAYQKDWRSNLKRTDLSCHYVLLIIFLNTLRF
ncbi:hypothetical protein UlMin_001409 [Ulmus minor]